MIKQAYNKNQRQSTPVKYVGVSVTQTDMERLSTLTEAECTQCLPITEGTRVKVLRVIDGDTLMLGMIRDAHTVKIGCRIIGIDTPEMHSRNAHEKQMALRAKQILESVAMGKLATVCKVGHDKFGRGLSDLRIDDGPASVSAFMLAQGSDLVHTYDGGTKVSWAAPEE